MNCIPLFIIRELKKYMVFMIKEIKSFRDKCKLDNKEPNRNYRTKTSNL